MSEDSAKNIEQEVLDAAKKLHKEIYEEKFITVGIFPACDLLEDKLDEAIISLGYDAADYSSGDKRRILWNIAEAIWQKMHNLNLHDDYECNVLAACSALAIPDYDETSIKEYFPTDAFSAFVKDQRKREERGKAFITDRLLVKSSESAVLRKSISAYYIKGKNPVKVRNRQGYPNSLKWEKRQIDACADFLEEVSKCLGSSSMMAKILDKATLSDNLADPLAVSRCSSSPMLVDSDSHEEFLTMLKSVLCEDSLHKVSDKLKEGFLEQAASEDAGEVNQEAVVPEEETATVLSDSNSYECVAVLLERLSNEFGETELMPEEIKELRSDLILYALQAKHKMYFLDDYADFEEDEEFVLYVVVPNPDSQHHFKESRGTAEDFIRYVLQRGVEISPQIDEFDDGTGIVKESIIEIKLSELPAKSAIDQEESETYSVRGFAKSKLGIAFMYALAIFVAILTGAFLVQEFIYSDTGGYEQDFEPVDMTARLNRLYGIDDSSELLSPRTEAEDAGRFFSPDRPLFFFNNLPDHIVLNSMISDFAGDQRNFIQIRDLTEDGDWGTSAHMKRGHTYQVRIVVSNNVDPQSRTIWAEGVRAFVTLPNHIATSMDINGTVSATNATPQRVSARAGLWADEDFSIQLIDNSVTLSSIRLRDVPLNESLFTNEGISLSAGGFRDDSDELNGYLAPTYPQGEDSDRGNYIRVYFNVRPEFSVSQADFSLDVKVRKQGETEWRTRLDVEPGDTVEYLLTYTNIGVSTQENVVLRFSLDQIGELVPDSTYLRNGNNPDGKLMADDVATAGLDIGSYYPGAGAFLHFAVILPEDMSYYPYEQNRFQNLATVTVGNERLSKRGTILQVHP